MEVAWGILILVLGSLAWLGQGLSWLSPAAAVRLGLTEAEATVEPAFWADGVGEAMWDTATLWVMVVAGLLLIVGEPAWALFGLAGGAIYVYFGGRGIATRQRLVAAGFRVGTPASVRLGLLMLGVWGVTGAITALAAAVTLVA